MNMEAVVRQLASCHARIYQSLAVDRLAAVWGTAGIEEKVAAVPPRPVVGLEGLAGGDHALLS